MLSEEEFAATAVMLFQIFQSLVPLDTGNMRYNATRFECRGNGEYAIIVDGELAPYAVFTNEPWISPKWNGKKNPNEKWVDSGFELLATMAAEILDGEIRRVK